MERWQKFVAAGRFWYNSEWSTVTLSQKVGLADWRIFGSCELFAGAGLPSACLVQYEHAAASSLASHIKRQCVSEGLLLRVLNTLQLGRRQQSSGRGRFKLGESAAQTFTKLANHGCGAGILFDEGEKRLEKVGAMEHCPGQGFLRLWVLSKNSWPTSICVVSCLVFGAPVSCHSLKV